MRRVEWMAVAWGGLFAGIGLVVAADDPGGIRIVVAVAIVALAGYLAGVRAEDRRIVHAALGAVAGVGFYAIFVVLTWVVAVFGGPRRAGFLPGGEDGWPWHVAAYAVAALVGGTVAALRLRPSGDQRSRRRYED